MRKSLLVIFMLLNAFIFAQDGPKVALPEKEFSFGDLVEGTIVTHDFKIKNEGNEILKILKVRTSCGCTAVAPEKKELKPGEETVIKVKFNTANRLGIQKKHVYVFTNDKKRPQVRLSFNAFVITKEEAEKLKEDAPRLRILENRHNFGVVPKGRIEEWKTKLKNVGKEDLKIFEVHSTCSCVNAYVSSKILKPGEEAILTVEFNTEDRGGSLTRTVEIKTNDPFNPDHTITLFVYIPRNKK